MSMAAHSSTEPCGRVSNGRKWEIEVPNLDGRIAVITGAGSGIGRGIAMVLAELGAHIVVVDIDLDAAETVTGEIRSLGGRAIAYQADVTDRESTDALVSAAISGMDHVDILVNNAGVGGAPGWWQRSSPSPQDWETTYDVNVIGIVNTTSSFQDHLKERRSGRIINIASAAGRRGTGGFAHYSASKAAAINVSQGFALQLAPFDINVNAICPGLLWTPLWEKIAERDRIKSGETVLTGRQVFDQRLEASTPLGREQTPEDVGKLAAFLASDRSKNITGQSINLNGGSYMN
jgi:meso-butanediol dehydrogenase/(S,S)-butanediol dehydrogenase/diacetyl reductase